MGCSHKPSLAFLIMTAVAVIGAGLVGCLAALGLKKKGYDVTIYELRDDPRKFKNKNLRSINLAVSERGLNALKYVDEDLAQTVLSKIIPMSGRMIHHLDGKQESQRYGLYGQAINSIDRSFLNDVLLDELSSHEIKVLFNYKLTKLDLNNQPTLYFQNGGQVNVDLVIGADGSFSKVRQELQKYVLMDYHQEYINSAYLELSIAPTDSGDGDDRFPLNKNHLHIWPRHNFMLIALPNLDGSFTSTFFAPWELINSLDSDIKILDFFTKEFPDAVPLLTEEKLLFAFKNHPKGKLLSLTCSTYHFEDKAIILGDAAHSMVPFYGQGMNCGFEDVFVLLNILEKNNENLSRTLEEYSRTRHSDLVAIIELAKENYKEMSHKVTSKIFLFKKQIDFILTKILKDRWLPLYTMVSFRSDISYSKAITTSRRQERILEYIQLSVLGASSIGIFKLLDWLRKK